MTEATRALDAQMKMVYAAYCEVLSKECRAQIPMEYLGCSAEEDYAEMALDVTPDMRNVYNTLHGGLTATIFDTAMGLFLRAHTGIHSSSTVEMQVSYQRPVPMGTRLHLRTQLQSCGRTLAHLRAEAYAADAPNRVLASATGIYYVWYKDTKES